MSPGPAAAEQERWGEHLPGDGFEFLGNGSLEVSERVLSGTMTGNPYGISRLLCYAVYTLRTAV